MKCADDGLAIANAPDGVVSFDIPSEPVAF
jgi:hypothetical protein